MQFIMIEGEPFRGHVQSVLNDDGTVAYSGGLTLAEYEAERGVKCRVISEDELDRLSAEYVDSLVTGASEITKDKYWYALEVLPPCKWRTARGIESFHISERLTHDLVAWYAKCGDRYFTFNDRSRLTADEVAEKVAAAL